MGCFFAVVDTNILCKDDRDIKLECNFDTKQILNKIVKDFNVQLSLTYFYNTQYKLDSR